MYWHKQPGRWHGISVAWRIWLLIFVSYSYFLSSDNPNETSRIALTLAIVERHALTIDPFAPLTIDKAFSNGSYYSDKAPGLSLLAVPVTFLAVKVLNRDADPETWLTPGHGLSRKFAAVVYLSTLSTVALLAAFAVMTVYRWTRWRGASDRAALFAAVTLGFATPFFGWSTVFFGHAASGSLLLMGFASLTRAMDEPAPVWRASLAGLLLGFAFVVEFPAGPVVAIIGLSLGIAALLRPDRWRIVARVLMPSAAGVALALVPLLIYNYLAFGSPLIPGYENVRGFEGMKTGFFGVSLPDPHVALELLIGWYRGLLPFSPVLALVPVAVVVVYRDPAWRLAAIVPGLAFLYYLAMNAGYYYWDGGFSTGPRHLIPALPLLALPLARLWDAAGHYLRYAFLLLLAVSVILSLICVSVDMFAPRLDHPNPLIDYLLPKALDGDFDRILIAKKFLGFTGPLALLPLLVAWLAIGWPLPRQTAAGQSAA